MTDKAWEVLFEILKTGGILVGMAASAGLFYIILRFQKTGGNGFGEKIARLNEQLAGLQGLPIALADLSASLKTLAVTIPTKQELTDGFQENRHDARNAINASGLNIQAAIERAENALMGNRRPRKVRSRKERRRV